MISILKEHGMNMKEPSNQPCETPILYFIIKKFVPLNKTYLGLFVRQDANQLFEIPQIP